MKKDHAVFLACGLAFGFLLGYGAFTVVANQPGLDGAAGGDAIASPAGPPAPTMGGGAPAAGGGGGGAPMVAEINALKRQLPADPADDTVAVLPALVRLANLHHDVQMWAQAIEFYERALAVRPDDPDVMTDLGTCYRGRGDAEKALALFERAAELDPNHWQSMFNSAIVLTFDLGRFDEARAMTDRLAALPSPPPQLQDLRRAIDRAEAEASGGGS